MPVKMSGAKYKAFLLAEWGPDAMWEETEILRSGVPVDEDQDSDASLYADDDVVTIVAGTIIPDRSLSPALIEYVDAVKFARKWLKAQNVVTLLVEVPREYADRLAKAIAGNGINGRMAKVVGRL